MLNKSTSWQLWLLQQGHCTAHCPTCSQYYYCTFWGAETRLSVLVYDKLCLSKSPGSSSISNIDNQKSYCLAQRSLLMWIKFRKSLRNTKYQMAAAIAEFIHELIFYSNCTFLHHIICNSIGHPTMGNLEKKKWSGVGSGWKLGRNYEESRSFS